jgi:hypothetical protein
MQYNRKAALKEDHTPHYGDRTHYGMTLMMATKPKLVVL